MGTDDGTDSSLLRALTDLQDNASLAGFLQIAFDAVVTFNSQERIVSWNPAAERMFGWKLEEALGKTPAELFWPQDIPLGQEYKKQRQARLNRGETLQGKLTPCRKDGSSFPAQYAARALFASNGKINGYLAVYRDLSDQVYAQEKEGQLQQSNQRLNEILASIQDDFYVLNRDWVFVFASRTFTSRIGKAPEDFVGNNIWEMFPKHVGTLYEENLRATMEKREIRRFEIPGKYTDAWYSMAAFPSEDGITVLGRDITERKRAERTIAENQRKYQDMIETTSDFIWEMDTLGRYTYCSPQMEYLWGLKPDNMLGKTPFEIMPDEERRRVRKYFRALVNSATPFRGLTTTAFDSQGQLIFIETSGVPFFDQNGQLLGFRGITRDVTERKRAEQALQESEERYRHLVQYAPSGIYEIDIPTRRFTEVNDIMCEILGYTREELLSLSPEELLDEESRTRFRQRILQTLSGKNISEQTEYKVRAKDGHEIWAVLNITINHENGRPKSVSVIAHNITERKRAEEARVQAMQELQAHLDNSPLAVISFDREFYILEWSAGAQRMFGWGAEEVLGKRIADLHWVYEEDARRVARLSEDMLAGRQLSNVHANRNYRKDGSIIECEWYNSALLDANGQLISVRSQVLDVTQRKQAENALLEKDKQLLSLNENLEQKVQEKTEEVRRLASDLTRAVQRERYRISHILHDDLQQRIYALQMQLAFLRYELKQDSETARNELTDVEKELLEILELTRHLSIDLSPPILQNEGLTQAISWLAGQMKQRYGLTIEIQADGPFAVPEEELHVLLFNCVRELLFNVVKHSGTNQALVKLDWLDDGLRIEVSDAGKGFPVNRPGELTGAETSEEDRPQSFGLPTIRKQLSLFGGQMEIQSRSGAGTQIILFVPVSHDRS